MLSGMSVKPDKKGRKCSGSNLRHLGNYAECHYDLLNGLTDFYENSNILKLLFFSIEFTFI